MKRVLKSEIKKAVKQLVEAYKPIKIFLFGSYAWGNPSAESDIDLWIVVPNDTILDKPRALKGHIALQDFAFPKDIMVSYQSEFDERAFHPSTLHYKVKNEGKIMYERT